MTLPTPDQLYAALDNLYVDATNGSKLYQDPPGDVPLRNGDVVPNLRKRLQAVTDAADQLGALSDAISTTEASAERAEAAADSLMPYSNYAAALAAYPFPAPVLRTAWITSRGQMVEISRAAGATMLPAMADWVPVGVHLLEHWGIETHTSPSAARAAVAAMTTGQRTAHQAAVSAAFGSATGRLILTGWVEALDHIIANPYRIIDMDKPVDQAGITVSSARFNMAAEAILSGGTSVRGCIIEKLHITCEQDAVGASGNRADVVAYPPSFIPKGDFGRCDYMRLSLANRAIDEVTGGANNGGWTFGRVEISAFGRPFNFDGDLHHITISDVIDVWVYGMNANQQAVAYDGNTPYARIGRVDTLSASAIKIFRQCGLEIDSDYNGAVGGSNEGIPIMIDRFGGDGDMATLLLKSGRSLIGLAYGTDGAAAPVLPWKVKCEGGDHTLHGFDYIGDAADVALVTGGHLKMISPGIFNTNAGGYLGRVTGGELTLITPRLRWPNAVRTVPAIRQTGAGAVLRVIDPIVDPSITVGTNVVQYNNDNPSNVCRADAIAPHSVVFTTAWSQGWYKSSGVTSARARVQDHLIIDSGAADGGNLELRSAGHPAWTVDNLDGQLRFVRDAVARVGFTNTTASINLQVTGTAVTQTAVDATPGRLVKTGDFGLGHAGQPFSIPDLDSLTTPVGFYTVFSTTLNVASRPAGASSFGAVEVRRYDGNRLWQIYYDRADGSGAGVRTWTRGSDANGLWQAWRQTYQSSNILGAVSQSGGVPTGAIIERGSNSNGEYVRFADGTQICTHYGPPLTCNLAVGALFMCDSLQSWTYPAAFVAGSEPTISGNAGSAGRWLAPSSATLTSCSYCIYSPLAETTIRYPRLMAVGRWF